MSHGQIKSFNESITSSNTEGYSGILGGHSVNEAIASNDNKGYSGIVGGHSVNYELLQAVKMKDVVESWEVILLMKLLQAVTMKDILGSHNETIGRSDNEGYSGILGGHSVNEAIRSNDNEGSSRILGGHYVNGLNLGKLVKEWFIRKP